MKPSPGLVFLKLGGALLEDPGPRRRLAASLARRWKEGLRFALVHGGGAQLGRAAKERGLEERRVQGLRITDETTALLGMRVLAGEVNKRLVASLCEAGLPALGLCGADLSLFRPRRKSLPGADLGYVGGLAPSDCDGEALGALLARDLCPVLATVGPGREEGPEAPFLNVNADEAAGPLAAAAGAARLLLVTEVEGVLDGTGALIPRIRAEKIEDLIAAGTVRGGMVPKLRAARVALEGGVAEVRILGAPDGDPLEAACAGAGTEVFR